MWIVICIQNLIPETGTLFHFNQAGCFSITAQLSTLSTKVLTCNAYVSGEVHIRSYISPFFLLFFSTNF